jgi:hypothetical protein
MLPDHLALLGNLLEQNGAAWCYSRPLWVSTDGVIVPFCTNLGLADELRAFLQDRNTIPTSCVAHSRAALEQVGFWPEDVPFAADWVLWRRMITRGGSAAYFRQPTNLHFSANWKQSRFSGISEVKVLLEIADNASWWPSILRNTSAAEPEQATIWRAIIRSAATLGSKICAKRRRRLSTGSHGWPCVISTPVLRQHLQLRQDRRRLPRQRLQLRQDQRRLPRQRLQLRQDQRRLPRLFEQKLRLCALALPGASRHHSATLRDAFAISATSLGEKTISAAATRENTRDQQVPLRGKIRKAQSAHTFPLHLRKPTSDFVV